MRVFKTKKLPCLPPVFLLVRALVSTLIFRQFFWKLFSLNFSTSLPENLIKYWQYCVSSGELFF